MVGNSGVSIPHRYGTTTDFIRSLVFIILLFPRFSTVLAKKVGLPRARNTLFPAFFKMVGGRPTFSLFLAQNQLFFYQKMPRNLYFTRKIADRLFYPIYQKNRKERRFSLPSPSYYASCVVWLNCLFTSAESIGGNTTNGVCFGKSPLCANGNQLHIKIDTFHIFSSNS